MKEMLAQTVKLTGEEAMKIYMNCTCFTCTHWNGSRRKDRAYCKKLFLSGKDAPSGDDVCELWEKRSNARMPKYNTLDNTSKI